MSTPTPDIDDRIRAQQQYTLRNWRLQNRNMRTFGRFEWDGGDVGWKKLFCVYFEFNSEKKERISVDFYAEHCSSEWTQILDKCLIGNQFSCLFFLFSSSLFLASSNIVIWTHIHIMHDIPQSTEYIFPLFPKIECMPSATYECGGGGDCGKTLPNFYFYCQEERKYKYEIPRSHFIAPSLSTEWWSERVGLSRIDNK